MTIYDLNAKAFERQLIRGHFLPPHQYLSKYFTCHIFGGPAINNAIRFRQEPHSALKNITRVCLLTNFTLILAWSPEEAGKIIETYKMLENKPPDLIRERPDQHPHQKVVQNDMESG